MSNVIMGFDFSKNQILELLYCNANREISTRDAQTIIARIENESSRHMSNVKFWYSLIDLEVNRLFSLEDEDYQKATPFTRYFDMMFPLAAENVEFAVKNWWTKNL